jgi:glycosyltransferase involved in cell wall biosynthesis
MANALHFSIVVPFYNESENLPTLIKELDELLEHLHQPAEMVLVNDGSTDLFDRPSKSPRFPIRWLDLSENSGQSAALYYGIQAAGGEKIILLDADLQNDPFDVPKMLDHLCQWDLDLVTGVRLARQDTWFRRMSSRIGNGVRRFFLRDKTTDTGCTLKVMRGDLARRLPGWNGMHRFIPALALAMGYRIGETPVSHRARHAGVSKVHGRKRAWRVTWDLLGMVWFSSRQFKGRLLPENGGRSPSPSPPPP